MEEKYNIAYGSNLNLSQMARRCPQAKVIGTAAIEGYQLLFKGNEEGFYLTIEEKEGASVPVGIWAINEKDEQSLDFYEDYPALYYKKWFKLAVKRTDSKQTEELDCFAYVMYEDNEIGMPTDRYVNTCLKGYEDFGFDPEYLQQAAAISQKAETAKEEN